jgi:hypothetical protein
VILSVWIHVASMWGEREGFGTYCAS